VVIPDAVEKELRQGAHSKPYLASVLSAAWIDIAVLSRGPVSDTPIGRVVRPWLCVFSSNRKGPDRRLSNRYLERVLGD
jgi:hypothetical protein